MAEMRVEYSSNNSGGSWWLKDRDWLALEKAGWHVIWGGRYYCHDKDSCSWNKRPDGKPEPCSSGAECKGHRIFDSLSEMGKEDGFLGAKAEYAEKDCASLAEAIRDWELATGMDASDEGCNCCGAPHSFSAREGDKYEYASGDGTRRSCIASRGCRTR